MPVDIFNSDETNKYITIQHGDATLKVFYFGANITSWTYQGEERLFTSSKAITTGPKAIRGGIPIVFPQFGPDALPGYSKLPQHGFARLVCWDFAGVTVDNLEKTEINFTLKNGPWIPESQREIWNHDFKLVYSIALQQNTLKTNLSVQNTGTSAFSFTTLLHTYFKVDSIDALRIKGLCGYKYKEFKEDASEDRAAISIASEVDRVYANAKTPAITLENSVSSKSLVLTKSDNFKDVVVWNPWIENAKKMADFGDEEYRNMVCVEVGAVVDPIILDAGQSWQAHQVLVAL